MRGRFYSGVFFALRRIFWYPKDVTRSVYFGYEFSKMASTSLCFLGFSFGAGSTLHDCFFVSATHVFLALFSGI